jgi:hypothetical protein
MFKPPKFLLLLLVMTAFFGMVSVVSAEETILQFNLTGALTGDTDTLIINDIEEESEVTLTVLSGSGEWQLDVIGPDNGVVDSVTSVDFEDGELFIDFTVDDGGNYALIFTVTGADAAEVSGTIVIATEDNDDDCGDENDDCDDDDDDPYKQINIGISVKIFIVINFDGSYTCNFYAIGDDDDDADSDGDGFIVISITSIQIAAILAEYDLENLTENILLAESDDGEYTLWYLTTGEYQINSKPDKEGKVEVLIYDNFPPTKVYRKDFNVYDILDPKDD